MNVVGRSIKDVQVEVTARQHRWMADEAMGAGRDQGPNPYELECRAAALAGRRTQRCGGRAGIRDRRPTAQPITTVTGPAPACSGHRQADGCVG